MLNIEKYKKEIALRINAFDYNVSYATLTLMKCLDPNVFEGNCGNKALKILDWLCSEYQEPILTDKEKEYLSAVIKPFRNKIISIGKYYFGSEEEVIITFDKEGNDIMKFPSFETGTMYKGMQINKEYTLEELGL